MIKSSDAYREAVVADARRVSIRAVIDVIDPDMDQGAVAGSTQDTDISLPAQVWDKKFQVTANYAALEPCRWILDGNTKLLPESTGAAPDWEAGYIGFSLSGADGTFSTPQFVQISFANVTILQACSVAFSDRVEDGVAEDFKVEVIQNGVAYHTETVTGNRESLYPVTQFTVMEPDTVRVTVTKWSLPGRRIRIVEIVPGLYEEWTGDMMNQFSIKQQCDPSCLTIPYGTATIVLDNLNRRFEPRNRKGVFQMIEERQGIKLYMGVRLPDGTVEEKPLGMFYQYAGGWKTGDNGITMKWELTDIVGLIANRTYIQPPKTAAPTTLKGWLEALAGQLGKHFKNRVRVDPGYADLPVTGDASGLSCGDVLRYVCMATGTFPRADASTGYLAAEPAWNEGNKITLDNLNKYPVMCANDNVAAVIVNDYVGPGNSETASKTIEVSNPFVGSAAKDKKLKIYQSIISACGGNRLELVGRGDPSSEVGDVDVVWLDENRATSARRILQDLSLSGGVLKNCKSVLLRGDGIFTYTKSEKFIDPGTFVAPPGVYRGRLILVGKGTDGGPGGDGMWHNYLNQELNAQAPNGGLGEGGGLAPGGKVWTGFINVNPGQVFQVGIGEETTFGPYSSANGKRYPGGFTDVSTGDVYARAGGRGGKGTGDGGVGGRGGIGGLWHIQGVWHYDHGGIGINPGDDSPGHWETITVIDRYPTKGEGGSKGFTGCAIIYWEPPEEEPA